MCYSGGLKVDLVDLNMTLADFLDSLPYGGKRDFAERLGINETYLYQLGRGLRRASIHRCLEIETLTHGEVTRRDLRPDIDWEGIADLLTGGLERSE